MYIPERLVGEKLLQFIYIKLYNPIRDVLSHFDYSEKVSPRSYP